MPEVPIVKTPISLRDLGTIVRGGLTARFGTLTREFARMILAHLSFETGEGSKSVDYSLGNLMAAGFVNGVEHFTWSGDYWRPPWYRDATNPLHTEMLSGKQPSAFRAYSGYGAALDGYLNLIEEDRYLPLVAAAKTGDPAKFAQAIDSTGYTSELDVQATATTLGEILKTIAADGIYSDLPSILPPPPPPTPAPISFGDLPILRQGIVGYSGHIAVWQKLIGAPITGKFDTATDTLTRTFQAAHGITVDGIVGPKETWKAALS